MTCAWTGSRADVVVRLAGESGEGVISAGELLARAAAAGGWWVTTSRTNPAEVRGGHCTFQIRLATGRTSWPGDEADALVAFNQEAIDRSLGDLAADGVLLYDPVEGRPPAGFDPARAVPVALADLTRERIGHALAKNVVACGAVGALVGLDPEDLATEVGRRYAHRPARDRERNGAALAVGIEAGVELGSGGGPVAGLGLADPPPAVARALVSGNQALCLGAVAAGCRFVAGYPITPASEILEWMTARLPRLGGTAIQFEDEIASLAAVIGASFAGRKAMTPTSGPGLSLMTELMGLAAMAEIPCVIVDGQRGGPSTGLPTATEQSDLHHAVHGGHGDLPRVVLAPTTVADCFAVAVEAFNAAEAGLLPVIVLTDTALSQRLETVPVDELVAARVVERRRATPEELRDFRRYSLEGGPVPAVSVPGDPGGAHVATGLAHGEDGEPDDDPVVHAAMQARRLASVGVAVAAAVDPGRPMILGGDRSATVGLIAWGSSEAAVREAVAALAAAGKPVESCVVRLVHPLPDGEIAAFCAGKSRVVVCEGNAGGQLAGLVRAATGVPVEAVAMAMGRHWRAAEIAAAVSGARVGEEVPVGS